MNNLPILKIEIQHLKTCVYHAFSEQQIKMDEMFKSVLEEVCAPEQVKSVLAAAVAKEIEEAIKAEVHAFFSYGKGRDEVKKAVVAKIEEEMARER